jgi:cell division protein ZapA
MDPDPAKQIVRVSIFNQTYSVATFGDPQDTEDLAREVDELMATIARRAGNLDSTRTAVLACLHLADKLRTSERELEALKESVENRTRNFAVLLDKVFLDPEAGTVPK